MKNEYLKNPNNIRKLLENGYKKARATSIYPNIEMTEHYEKYPHNPHLFIYKLTNKEFKLTVSRVIDPSHDNIISNISYGMAKDILRQITILK
jgi:hypothetical protein